MRLIDSKFNEAGKQLALASKGLAVSGFNRSRDWQCSLLADSGQRQLIGVTGRYYSQSSYSKDAKFNGAYSSSRPIADFRNARRIEYGGDFYHVQAKTCRLRLDTSNRFESSYCATVDQRVWLCKVVQVIEIRQAYFVPVNLHSIFS